MQKTRAAGERFFSNVRNVLSQCNTRLRLLHLLYDIYKVMWRKTIKQAFSMFYLYRLTHSASALSGFTCTSLLTMNEKFQYRTRLKKITRTLTIFEEHGIMALLLKTGSLDNAIREFSLA